MLLLLSLPCAAQAVSVSNQTPHAWRGWLRVPQPAPYAAARLEAQAAWVVAADDGYCDLYASVPAVSVASFDLTNAQAWYRPLPQFYDLGGVHGGLPTVNGRSMDFRSVGVDGAALRLKWSCVLDENWVAGLSVLIYPSDRCFFVGEASLLCWTPASPTEPTTLPYAVAFAWGSATTPAASWLQAHQQAHGEAQRRRVVFAWPSLCSTDAANAAACARLGGPVVN